MGPPYRKGPRVHLACKKWAPKKHEKVNTAGAVLTTSCTDGLRNTNLTYTTTFPSYALIARKRRFYLLPLPFFFCAYERYF